MKKIIPILAILLTVSATAQTMKRIPPPIISFQVVQDVKLATSEDDFGNKPWTWDIYSTVRFNGYRNENTGVSMFLGLKYQYANLAGGDLNRYGLEAGVDFPVLWTSKGTFGTRRLIGATAAVGWGKINRQQFGTGILDSWEFTAETWIEPVKGVAFVLGHYFTDRRDIGKWRYNFTAGFRFTIN